VSLDAQLSGWGFLLAFALVVLLWFAALAVGTALLPESRSRITTIDRMALAGPWGLLFLVSLFAALMSSGRSLLSPLPLLQVGLWLGDRRRNRLRTSEAAPEPDGGPGRVGIFIFFAVVVVCAQLVYLTGTMPYRGDGRWQMPHEDYAWWGLLSQRVALDGVESLSPPASRVFIPAGAPVLHWYHWTEFWLAGIVWRWLSLNPMLVLLLVVYPLFVGMAGVCCGALLSHVVRWRRAAWVLCLGPLVVTSLGDVLWPLDAAGLGDFSYLYAVVNNTNYLLAVVLALCWTLQILRRRCARAALLMGIAALLAPPLVPLLLSVLCGAALWELARGRAAWTAPVFTLAVRGAGWIAIAYLWLIVSDHDALGPQATPIRANLADIALRWQPILFDSLAQWARALVFGAPLLFGLYRLSRSASSTDDVPSATPAIALAAAGLVVSYPVVGVLGGWSGSEASYVSDLMWQCLLLPLGWMGLAAYLLESSRRWVGAMAVAAFASGAIAGVAGQFRYDLARSVGTFTARDAASLHRACGGRKAGYFAPESERERPWWFSVQSGWALLSDCDFVRLNQLSWETREGIERAFWEASPPAMFTRSEGKVWDNSAETVLAFARRYGIDTIAESRRNPVPSEFAPYLVKSGAGGPFTLYGVTPAAASRAVTLSVHRP
jgi:hypothetical protein